MTVAHSPMPDYQPPTDDGLAVLYCDEGLLVVDKPSGLLSVPGRGDDKQDCLLSRAQRDYPEALIVHRLDMETSGVMVLARNKVMHRQLSLLFQNREVTKRYIAVVDGRIADAAGKIDLPLICDWPNRPRQIVDHQQGKPSLTYYKVLWRDVEQGITRVELQPETGRSHQLRVHLQSLGHPILGDRLYASPAQQAKAPRLLLHALSLAFVHPLSAEPLRFICEPGF
ncbi:MAG: pseudouridine synthase [Gammaproteobacteria bacterium]|nr:pseudouridine synthase [Gammaproteobacteria bacterium]